jgi:hypothetical protein
MSCIEIEIQASRFTFRLFALESFCLETSRKSFKMTFDLGFRVIGCPNEDFLNIQCYARELDEAAGTDRNSLGLGMLDTDWRSPAEYIGEAKTASASWNRIVNTTLNCTN